MNYIIPITGIAGILILNAVCKFGYGQDIDSARTIDNNRYLNIIQYIIPVWLLFPILGALIMIAVVGAAVLLFAAIVYFITGNF